MRIRVLPGGIDDVAAERGGIAHTIAAQLRRATDQHNHESAAQMGILLIHVVVDHLKIRLEQLDRRFTRVFVGGIEENRIHNTVLEAGERGWG